MNDNTIETIMRSYAHSAVSDKKQDPVTLYDASGGWVSGW